LGRKAARWGKREQGKGEESKQTGRGRGGERREERGERHGPRPHPRPSTPISAHFPDDPEKKKMEENIR